MHNNNSVSNGVKLISRDHLLFIMSSRYYQKSSPEGGSCSPGRGIWNGVARSSKWEGDREL